MTIMGLHTVPETRDLLNVANYRFRETFKAFDALPEKPADLTTDVGNLARKWQEASTRIDGELKSLSGGLVNEQYVSAEYAWNEILGFIQFQENVPGSLQDITRRIEKLSGKPIVYENQPKQDSKDSDINYMKTVDEYEKKAKETATKTAYIVGGTVLVTLVGVGVAKHYLK